jgi:glycine cleavage system H protein
MSDHSFFTDPVFYNRVRFKTKIPGDRLYTASHYWMAPEEAPNTWRVGLTTFATRMLGEMVEHDLELPDDRTIQCGQIIGWMEGFKATSDIYAMIDGCFLEENPLLEDNLEALSERPHGKGWLYHASGDPEPTHYDATGYAAFLDETIDRMLGEGYDEP